MRKVRKCYRQNPGVVGGRDRDGHRETEEERVETARNVEIGGNPGMGLG